MLTRHLYRRRNAIRRFHRSSLLAAGTIDESVVKNAREPVIDVVEIRLFRQLFPSQQADLLNEILRVGAIARKAAGYAIQAAQFWLNLRFEALKSICHGAAAAQVFLVWLYTHPGKKRNG